MPVTLFPPERAELPIAKAAVAGELLFCTIVPDDETGVIVGESALDQARVVFANLARVLAECGSTLADTAHVTVEITAIAHVG